MYSANEGAPVGLAAKAAVARRLAATAAKLKRNRERTKKDV
jgi:hypothetical protein